MIYNTSILSAFHTQIGSVPMNLSMLIIVLFFIESKHSKSHSHDKDEDEEEPNLRNWLVFVHSAQIVAIVGYRFVPKNSSEVTVAVWKALKLMTAVL